MIGFFRRLLKDRRGNVLMIAGAGLPVVVGAAGLATDTIQWTLWKRQLQRAADSAAIAGVYNREKASGATTTTASAVSHDLTINLHTSPSLMSGYPQVTFPANTGVMSNQVQVVLAVQQRLPFSSLFLSTPPTITATATAAAVTTGGGVPCVQATEWLASQTGITHNGNTTIDMPDCEQFSNAPSVNSASAGGSSNVIAKAIGAVGGIAQSNNWNVQAYRPYSPALPDPFANVTPNPADMNCTTAGLTANTNITQVKADGINCFSSLDVGSNKTLDLGNWGGPIYINGGSADLKGTFNCTGCTIVLTNKDTSPTATIGTIDSNAQASNNITAPTSGTYAGIAIYQDRRATGNTNKINGGSSNIIRGAVYLPKDILWINGSGTGDALCAMWVARRIVFIGNSGIKLKGLNDAACAGSGLPTNNPVKIVRLVA